MGKKKEIHSGEQEQQLCQAVARYLAGAHSIPILTFSILAVSLLTTGLSLHQDGSLVY
jgi:hypothetical protein